MSVDHTLFQHCNPAEVAFVSFCCQIIGAVFLCVGDRAFIYGHVVLKAYNLLPCAAQTRTTVSKYSAQVHLVGCLTMPANCTSLYNAQLALRQNLMSNFLAFICCHVDVSTHRGITYQDGW